jgi:hypothetical protein
MTTDEAKRTLVRLGGGTWLRCTCLRCGVTLELEWKDPDLVCVVVPSPKGVHDVRWHRGDTTVGIRARAFPEEVVPGECDACFYRDTSKVPVEVFE